MKTIMTRLLTKVALECLKKLVERADNKFNDYTLKVVENELKR